MNTPTMSDLHMHNSGYQKLWPVSRSELAALADLGLSAGQIASYFGVTAGRVFQGLLDLGLAPPRQEFRPPMAAGHFRADRHRPADIKSML